MKYIALNNSPLAGGGVEQVVRNLLDHFRPDFKRDLCLICSDPARGKEFEYAGVRCINVKASWRGIADKMFFLGRYAYSYKLYKLLRALPQDSIGIVNVHGIEYAFFPAFFRSELPTGMQLIVTVHGSNFDEISQYVVRGLPWKFLPVKAFYFFYRWVHFFAEKRTCRGVDFFTFINEYTQRFYASRYRVEKTRGRVIYNGFEASEAKKRENKTSRTFRALIVGSTVYRKGLDLATGIVEKLRAEGHDVRLRIVGFADFPAYSRGRKWDFIDYIGRVPPEQMSRYYEEADFLLFPSRFEGFPLTVLEALQHKLPVIVSQACVFHEIPGYQALGVVVEGLDQDNWAQAVKENVLNLEKYNVFLRGLNRLDLSDFAWAKIAAQYEETLSR
ncbi:MAG TPA: glycosyltransferase family 4 protein [Verrucomicrobiae bacterium]|nr:glycosyltransferase family 4 protein [Verrucomicrobiae bacterium]